MDAGRRTRLLERLAQLSSGSCVTLNFIVSDAQKSIKEAPQISEYSSRKDWRAASAQHLRESNAVPIGAILKLLQDYAVTYSVMEQVGVVIVEGERDEIIRLLNEAPDFEVLKDIDLSL